MSFYLWFSCPTFVTAKKTVMEKRMYKYDNGATAKREPLITSENVSSTRDLHTESIPNQSVKKLALPVLVLLGLAGLIGASILNNNLLLEQIVICSVIVSLVLFVKVSGENAKNKS